MGTTESEKASLIWNFGLNETFADCQGRGKANFSVLNIYNIVIFLLLLALGIGARLEFLSVS